MGGKKQKKPGMEKNSSTSTSTTDETPTKRGEFLKTIVNI